MNRVFFEITVVLILATVLGLVAKRLKQPTILGYIATGLIVGPLGLLRLNNTETLDAMAQFGIAFLLFLVGMEMRLAELRHVGRSVLLIGVGQVVFTALAGLGIALFLGYASVPAAYIAITLTFSSTIIVIKLLSEKKALDSLYGKIVVGVLLVQDFIALGILMVLSGAPAGGTGPASLPIAGLALILAKGAVFLAVTLGLGRWVLPRLLKLVGGSPEILFLTSLAWGLGWSALAASPRVGFTIEIGSFLAGLALAGSVEHFQIASRVKPLRDFFVVMFFIVLGSKMILGDLSAVWKPTAIFSLFVLVGNPLIVLLIMGAIGYRARTSFMAGVTVAQISEFSLIVIALGHRLGHIDASVVTLVTAVGIVTITLSSYMILYSDALYRPLRGLLKFFEFRHGAENGRMHHALKDHVILVGCHRMGHNILHSLEGQHKEFVVIDFNPDIVKRLQKRGVQAIYGDIADPDIQEGAGLAQARLVVSTVPAVDDSLKLLHGVKRLNRKAKIILTAEDEHDAVRLYEAGADYVLLPHFIGGIQLAHLIREDKKLAALGGMRDRDLAVITEHP